MTLRKITKKVAGPDPKITQAQIDRYFDEANVNNDEFVSVGELLLFLGRHKLISQDNDF